MSGPVLGRAGLAVAALVVLASGVLLTRAGRPYGTPVLTVHKLVDLAAVVLAAWVLYRAVGAGRLSTPTIAGLVAVAVLAVATFASGGVLSAAAEAPAWALWLHRAGGFLLPVAAGLAIALAV